ncbi:MAG: hypothetical protein BWY78_00634 [Alphaproteobacteria bacterium ADurb.Bin438]|nr:MAG: hypothetical protein BWY78_00634 [Alphaproteobacteria bacterium ADurb.Bin438]
MYNNKPLLKSLGDYGESLQKRIISLNNFYEVDEINKKSLEKGNNDLNVGKAAVTKYEEIKPLTNDVKKIKVPDAYQAKFFEKANAR